MTRKFSFWTMLLVLAALVVGLTASSAIAETWNILSQAIGQTSVKSRF